MGTSFFSEWYKLARPSENKIKLIKDQLKLTDEQVELCISADPTEKDYVLWIAKHLKTGAIRLPEDTEKIKDQLTRFQKMRPELPVEQREISKYTPATLYQLVSQDTEEVNESNYDRKLKAGELLKEAKIWKQEGDYLIYELRSFSRMRLTGVPNLKSMLKDT